MSNNLTMRLQMMVADKVSAPLKRIQNASGASAKSLQAARDQLRRMEQQKGLIEKLRQQEGAWKATSQQLKIHQAQLQSMRNAGTATDAQLRRQTALVDKSSQALQRQSGRLTELRRQATNSGIGKLSTDEAKLSQSIAETTARLKEQEEVLKRIDGVKERRNQQLGTLAKVGGMGLGMRMLGQKGLGTAKNMMMPGYEFDVTMSHVQALTRLDKDSDQLAALRQQARDLGASTMFSAPEAAQGQAFLAMAGFTPEAIMAAMPGLLDMALAGDVDLARTADISSNILAGFGLDPSEMGRVGDVLTYAFTTSNTSLEQLGETMKYVAPQAKAAGVGLEETAAMAALLANIGIQGSSSGTMLRNMLGKLSDTGSKTLRGLGIKAADKDGNMKSITTLLFEINKATEGMGNAKRLTVLKDIFDVRGVAGASELLEQIAGGGLESYIEQLKNSQGTAAKTAAIMADNLRGDIDELSSAWEDFGIAAFEGVDSPLREIVRGVTSVIEKLNEWTKANPELVATIGKIVLGGLALLTVLGTLMMGVAALLAPLVILKASFAILSLKTFGLLGPLALLGKGFAALRLAVAAHPIVALVAVLVALAFAIYSNWDGLKEYFYALWDYVTGIFKWAIDGIVGLVTGLWDSVATFFGSGIGNISATILNWNPVGLFYRAFAEVFNWFGGELPETFTGFGGMLLDGLMDGIKEKFTALKESITGVGSSIAGWFRDTLKINSPSKVFMSMGGSISKGTALGILNELPKIESATDEMADATDGFGGQGGGSTPMLGSRAGSNVSYGGDTLIFNISGGTGQEQLSIKEQIEQALQEYELRKQARQRSSYFDVS